MWTGNSCAPSSSGVKEPLQHDQIDNTYNDGHGAVNLNKMLTDQAVLGEREISQKVIFCSDPVFGSCPIAPNTSDA